jgi:hypothetical protein
MLTHCELYVDDLVIAYVSVKVIEAVRARIDSMNAVESMITPYFCRVVDLTTTNTIKLEHFRFLWHNML